MESQRHAAAAFSLAEMAAGKAFSTQKRVSRRRHAAAVMKWSAMRLLHEGPMLEEVDQTEEGNRKVACTTRCQCTSSSLLLGAWNGMYSERRGREGRQRQPIAQQR